LPDTVIPEKTQTKIKKKPVKCKRRKRIYIKKGKKIVCVDINSAKFLYHKTIFNSAGLDSLIRQAQNSSTPSSKQMFSSTKMTEEASPIKKDSEPNIFRSRR
jgi:hypothetical protein